MICHKVFHFSIPQRFLHSQAWEMNILLGYRCPLSSATDCYWDIRVQFLPQNVVSTGAVGSSEFAWTPPYSKVPLIFLYSACIWQRPFKNVVQPLPGRPITISISPALMWPRKLCKSLRDGSLLWPNTDVALRTYRSTMDPTVGASACCSLIQLACGKLLLQRFCGVFLTPWPPPSISRWSHTIELSLFLADWQAVTKSATRSATKVQVAIAIDCSLVAAIASGKYRYRRRELSPMMDAVPYTKQSAPLMLSGMYVKLT